ncbi:MAG: GntR family transcriptional regulator [Bacillota bacterium]|nr:GntR family transcriptional regulator [Bacillota bacterium]
MKQTKQQYVYEYIKDKINKNEYPPGTPLTEEAICEELKVSRTPVRDAIRRLTGENLLVMTPGIGLSVSAIGLEDLIEIFDIREALEGMSVKQFIDRAPAAIVKRLRDCVDKGELAVADNNYNAFMESDMEFHRIIDATVGNKRLSVMLDAIYEQINRLAYTNREDPAISRLGITGHKEIMKFIEKGDKDGAVSAMEEHVRSVKKYYLTKYFNL